MHLGAWSLYNFTSWNWFSANHSSLVSSCSIPTSQHRHHPLRNSGQGCREGQDCELQYLGKGGVVSIPVQPDSVIVHSGDLESGQAFHTLLCRNLYLPGMEITILLRAACSLWVGGAASRKKKWLAQLLGTLRLVAVGRFTQLLWSLGVRPQGAYKVLHCPNTIPVLKSITYQVKNTMTDW
jgi:hypothetical protein